MSSVSALLGDSYAKHPLRDKFLKWQCLVRQIMRREPLGKPTNSVMPEVFLGNKSESIGSIVTIMNKIPMYSVIPEMLHMSRKTFDVAQRLSLALQYFSATYYQKPSQFSEILTATFQSRLQGANLITRASTCSLVFEAYAQRFELECTVEDFSDKNPLFISTLAHNLLFNPDFPADMRVLGIAPDWNATRSSP
ncbi:MAG: hypothetical protein CML56_04300 [Rhodobacteraceae bacterium]|nr:hypothetical protein [Paracoccaceae bacterium]